jgi:uncharacterized membrane protein
MDHSVWAKAHGATTHFPIALVLVSVVFDVAGCVWSERPASRDLHAAGYWTILIGALGSVAAVLSGLLMTKGSVLGHDALRIHHLFVWPAFALLVAGATWRALVGSRIERPMLIGYLIAMAIVAVLVTAAGYWGGEMMMSAR